jgi:ATP-dependent protease ClpP protease subunit
MRYKSKGLEQSADDRIFLAPKPVGIIYDFYLSGSIGGAEDYIKELNIFRNATPLDTINIFINSGGGSVFTGMQYINAMIDSAANIVTIVDGGAASMAAIIFLYGNEMIINNHAELMFHDISLGAIGKVGGEITSRIGSVENIRAKFEEQVINKYLSGDELDRMHNGADIYFTGEEFHNRIIHGPSGRLTEVKKPAKAKRKTKSKKKTYDLVKQVKKKPTVKDKK